MYDRVRCGARTLSVRACGRFAAGALLLAGLAACANDTATQTARQDAADHQNCLDLGFEEETEAYGNCRLKLRQVRATEASRNRSNVNVGVGIGIGL